MPGPYASELQVVGFGKETTWGTAATAPDYFVSATNIKWEDVIKYVDDDGARGVLAQPFQVFPGPANGDFSCDFPVFLDSIGRLLVAMIGPDTVTGSAAPYTHTFKLTPTAQPASLTCFYFDGYETRVQAGFRPTELTFKWSEGGEMTGSVKGVSKPSAVGAALTPSFGTLNALMGWQATLQVAGSPDLNLVGFDCSLKRKEYIQWAANNSQAPTNLIVKGLNVSGKLTLDLNDDTELTAFWNNTQPAVVITLTQSSGLSFKLQMSQCAFKKAPVGGKDVVQVDLDFEAVQNSTDGGPCQIVVQNAISQAY